MIGIAMAIFVILIILLIVYFNLRAESAKKSKEDKQVELAKRGKESLDKLERRLAKKPFKAELKEEMKPKGVGARFLRWVLACIAAAIFFGLIGLLMSSC